EGICEVHRRFGELLPNELPGLKILIPVNVSAWSRAHLRQRDVRVGDHVAISPGALPRFLERFEAVYNTAKKAETVLSAAAAHHRLLWIHPFLDGNGRVARLKSYSMLRDALDTGGTWSIARGLARQESAYKGHLQACDMPRRNDLDGRGSRSEEALAEFTRFFLQTCLWPGNFSWKASSSRDRLRDRISMWAEEEVRAETLLPQAGKVLDASSFQGRTAAW
ncbi:MAG: Fic family protein, partial [Woeseiaceae bacterium]|nr:Fic family protein [Woeseiaceae bacterium]